MLCVFNRKRRSFWTGRENNIYIYIYTNLIRNKLNPLSYTKQTRTVMGIMTDGAYRTRTRTILFIDVRVLVVIRKNATDHASASYENRHRGVTRLSYTTGAARHDDVSSMTKYTIEENIHEIIYYVIIIMYTRIYCFRPIKTRNACT